MQHRTFLNLLDMTGKYYLIFPLRFQRKRLRNEYFDSSNCIISKINIKKFVGLPVKIFDSNSICCTELKTVLKCNENTLRFIETILPQPHFQSDN